MRPTTRLLLALLVSRSVPCQVCDRSATSGASRDLYCLTLVAAPGMDPATGRVELARTPGPFTVNVVGDGRALYTPVVTVAGLPTPSALGPFTTYVGWVASPTMYPMIKLGALVGGQTRLREFALDPFVVLVTAEPSANVIAPSGRLVLRGSSPSSRLQPPDLMQFTIGSMGEGKGDSGGHMPMSMLGMTATSTDASTSVARWTGVPMPAGLTMVPGEMALRPAASPYLPRNPAAEPLAAAHPRELVRLTDGDTLHLTADLVERTIAGRHFTMYGFNRQDPGPLLSVRQGAEIVVDFANHLDQATSIHWHGLRLDNQSDGVVGLTQQPVAPGGRFVYHVRFPDAGIYWYHPHVAEETQQNLGLFANILVRPSRDDRASPVNRSEILMLDDLLIGDDGLVPYGGDAATHALMGRFGNVLLVNGELRYALAVNRGEVVRFVFTNASNARTYNLSFPGARMKIVGSDAGSFEHEAWIESVVIAPAERYVVAVRFDRPGDVALVNRVRGLDHFFNRFFFEADTLGVVHVAPSAAHPDLAASFATLHTDAAMSAEVERYRRDFDRPPDRTLVLTVETHGLPFVTRQLMQMDSAYFAPVEWAGTMPGMNWAATTDQVRWVLRDPATGKENMDIGWVFKQGDRVKLRLVNERVSLHAMQHPIHIHGQRFLVLAVNGVRNTNLVWKDTVLVPAGAAVDLLVDLSNPGRWMLHCHIAEHLAAQMMTVLTVQ